MKNLSNTLIQLTQILNDELYHDGDTIGKALNITRAGVWKAIKKLQDYGIQIESIKNKGYRAQEPLLLFNQHLIQQKLGDHNIQIEVFEDIDSTNSYLKKYIGSTVPKICIAECQSKGRGRLGRSWYAPFGQNIYLSLLYSFEKDMSELAGLSMVVSLAITKALGYLGLDHQISLKWPNDIMSENKKLAGSLIEIYSEANGLTYAIIGIGINVNMTQDNQIIDQPWTSLKQISNKYTDRNELCISLINNLISELQKFEQYGFKKFQQEWQTKDILFNKKIRLSSGNKIIEGIVRGINEQGNLLLENQNGLISQFSSGDTSILKE